MSGGSLATTSTPPVTCVFRRRRCCDDGRTLEAWLEPLEEAARTRTPPSVRDAIAPNEVSPVPTIGQWFRRRLRLTRDPDPACAAVPLGSPSVHGLEPARHLLSRIAVPVVQSLRELRGPLLRRVLSFDSEPAQPVPTATSPATSRRPPVRRTRLDIRARLVTRGVCW